MTTTTRVNISLMKKYQNAHYRIKIESFITNTKYIIEKT